MSEAINNTLIDLAVGGSAIGVFGLIIRDRFPEQWNILFPTKQQLYQSKTIALQAENRKLELLKNTLNKYKDEKTKMLNLTKETNNLVIEISKLENPQTIQPKSMKDQTKSVLKEIESFYNSKGKKK